MASILFKWLLAALITIPGMHVSLHPLFISVVEIDQNAKEKTVEVSCKIFTDDFEKTLRQAYHIHIDLMDPKNRTAMDKVVNDYVQKHLHIIIDGKNIQLKYIGYEQIEEGIYSYFEAGNITTVKDIIVTDDILYEYKKEQMSLLHVTVNGKRKSTRLNNPDKTSTFNF
ncbi:MAG: DUF6702 family protein [Ferruginibacter sp.]